MTDKAESTGSNSTRVVGCPCTSESSGALASLAERSCEISDGQNGVMLMAEGPCVPYSYGSGCGRHDLIHDPKCALADSGESGNPDYCLRSWCYVDAEVCRRSSPDRVFRSDHFSNDLQLLRPRSFIHEGVDLFYSYAACNSTAVDWINYRQQHILGGVSISTIIPTYKMPNMYKRNPSGDIIEAPGSEYYDSSVPFEGALTVYLDRLMRISNGDFNITYTYGSEAGRRVHQGNHYNGGIQDVADGLAETAAPAWITGERLRMTPFTVPLSYEKTVLVIPRPGHSFSGHLWKALEPLDVGVWGLVIALIIVTALISVWFSRYGKRFKQVKRPERAKKKFYARLALDEILKNGTFFCSGGVNQEDDASLPQKLLMFGFSFFILILVSSYVANLAAFLTRPVEYAGTIKDIVDRGFRVCANPSLQTELTKLWPGVKFVFSGEDRSDNIPYHLAVIKDYKEKKCEVIAAGRMAYPGEMLCEENLVFTETVFVENPIAFPIRPELAGGLSYWIDEGMKNHDVNYEAILKEYDKNYQEPKCILELSAHDQETSDYAPIEAYQLFFPIMFFVVFAILAIFLQLRHQWTLSQGETSVLGTPSSLEEHRRTFRWSIHRLTGYFSTNRPSENAHDDVNGDSEAQLHASTDVADNSVAVGDIPPGGFQSEDRFDDNYNEQTVKKRVRFSPNEDNAPSRASEGLLSFLDREDSASSRLQRACEEIFDCMDEIKRQKKEY